MSNSLDPDETAHYEPSHLDLRCLQKPITIAYGSERVKSIKSNKPWKGTRISGKVNSFLLECSAFVK